MKIALLTLGTRGDVQPFAVLGRALKGRGHEVTVATAKNFASFVESYGLAFAPVEADFQAILNSEEGKKMMSNPLSARKHLNRTIFPMMTDALSTFTGYPQPVIACCFMLKLWPTIFLINVRQHLSGQTWYLLLNQQMNL
jgi:UDP:flavonoid glycosyltransferase YjiC (YdhE family)